MNKRKISIEYKMIDSILDKLYYGDIDFETAKIEIFKHINLIHDMAYRDGKEDRPETGDFLSRLRK